MSRIPIDVAEAVQERAQRHCEACTWPMLGKMDFHHRKLRKHGGEDTVVNLIWVHHTCHVITPWAIHQNPGRSYRLGHLVHSWDDPELVRVLSAIDLRQLRR